MKIPELLAPAGNHEKLTTALHYGADAVYLGVSEFSLRAKADNFTADQLERAARYVRGKNKKFYVTVNIIPHNRDISLMKDHVLSLKKIGPDALIVSDPGVFEIVSEVAPELSIHVSAQANITNRMSAKFWEKMGAKRLVLSRELTVEEIREIRAHVSAELECFVHGALCISYSGRCYISSFLANRPANRGECANSCRWSYTLMEEKRPGEPMPVHEDDRGTYIMSSRDLCMIEHLDKLVDAGIDSFKIEGRMKGTNYVAGVVKTYREAVDSLMDRPYRVKKKWLQELSMFSSRGFTTGMFFGTQPDHDYNHDEEKIYRMSHELVGTVKSVENGRAVVALRNTLKIGDSIEFLSAGFENRPFEITELYNDQGVAIDGGHNEDIVLLPSRPGIREHDLIRRPLKPRA